MSICIDYSVPVHFEVFKGEWGKCSAQALLVLQRIMRLHHFLHLGRAVEPQHDQQFWTILEIKLTPFGWL